MEHSSRQVHILVIKIILHEKSYNSCFYDGIKLEIRKEGEISNQLEIK